MRRLLLLAALVALPLAVRAMTATWTLTTPIAQANQTKYMVGDPVLVSVSAGTATLPYQGQTAGGVAVTGASGSVVVNLTTADMQAIINTIVARAVANGQGIPAGTLSVP